MQSYWEYMETPIGTLVVKADDFGITKVYLGDENEKEQAGENSQNTKAQAYVKQACTELGEYFSGKRKKFDVPVHMQGTPFQESVWQALREIPYGETRSYKQIAERIGNPKAMRAVGMANNRNKILLLVPCHRVIGANGAMVGFGCGLSVKEYLLAMEKTYTFFN